MDDDDNFSRLDKKSTNYCAQLWSFVLSIGYDLLFCAFMVVQELNDTSYCHQLVMKTKYSDEALVAGSIVAHVSMNLIVITVFWMLFSIFNSRSVRLFGCCVIYFVIGYEMMFNCIKNMARLMELKE